MEKPKEMQLGSLGQEDPLEEEKATHSSILAWRIPWSEECGGLLCLELDMMEAIQHACSTNTIFCVSFFFLQDLFILYLLTWNFAIVFVCLFVLLLLLLFAFHIFYHYQKFEFYFLIVHCPDPRISMERLLPSFILFSQEKKLDNSLPFSILFIHKAHTFIKMYSYFFLPFKCLNRMVLNLTHL